VNAQDLDVEGAAVGLALMLFIYRYYRTTNLDEVDSMKG
jgi:NADH:ubiquinone oxidoreductase subunit K